ncbi:MAG: hypothetical protein MRY83_04330, partial [Flavobacteriales bacterium]|nr:hypothetical protein [Flavobacteriales bacterium]
MKQILLISLTILVGSLMAQQRASSAFPQYQNYHSITSPNEINFVDLETDQTDGSYYVLGEFIDEIDFGSVNLQANSTGPGKKKVFLVKFSSNHAFLWYKYLKSQNDILAKDIIIDPDNQDVYMTGAFKDMAYTDLGLNANGNFNGNSSIQEYSALPNQIDYFLNRVTTNGNTIWSSSGTNQILVNNAIVTDSTDEKVIEKLTMDKS